MLHWGQKSGLAFLLAVLFLLVPGAIAQNAPNTAMTSAPQHKPQARRKKTVPDPPAPVMPATPPTLADSSPTPAQVSYKNGQLTIVAQNSTLSQVLRSVGSLTGASVELPAGASAERVVGQLGPGEPRDVLNALLNGTKFNYIILGVTGNPGAVQKVILTTPKPATAVNTAQNNTAPPPEEPQEEENYGEPEPQPNPQAPLAPQFRHRPGMPVQPGAFVPPQPQIQPQPQPVDNSADTSQFNGGKTPEQLLQELQQMQQQQQQMQDQLNPANRQPNPQ